jgi:hypothetical protein
LPALLIGYGSQPVSYRYDIFLSYSTDYPFGDWVKEHFLRLLQGYAKQALLKEPSIFFDRETIITGQNWRAVILDALCHSKCLVAIWSPSYFISEWCKYECSAFLYRQSQRPAAETGLILPIKVYDGDCFPLAASSLQQLDLSN